jgi:hypothetical protein
MFSISNKNTNDFITLFFFKFYNKLVRFLAINLSHAIHKPIYNSKEIIIIKIAGESKKPIIFIILIIIFDILSSLSSRKSRFYSMPRSTFLSNPHINNPFVNKIDPALQ